MKGNEQRLDQLFEQARNQAPKTSYEDTKRAFIATLIAGFGGVLATKGLVKLLTIKKGIIMISTISILTTGAVVATMLTSPKAVNTIDNADTNSNIEVTSLPLDAPETIDVLEENTTMVVVDSQLDDSIEKKAVLVEKVDDNTFTALEEEKYYTPSDSSDLLEIDEVYKHVKLNEDTEKLEFDKRFVLTEHSSIGDLEALKLSAAAAGVIFDYRARFKHENIRKLYFKMELQNDSDEIGNQIVMSRTKTSGSFEYVIGWAANENGMATALLCGDDSDDEARAALEEIGKALEEETAKLESLLGDLDLNEYLIDVEEINSSVLANLENDMELMELDLQRYETLLDKALEDLDGDDLEPIIQEITELSNSILELVEFEIAKKQTELEKKQKAEEKNE